MRHFRHRRPEATVSFTLRRPPSPEGRTPVAGGAARLCEQASVEVHASIARNGTTWWLDSLGLRPLATDSRRLTPIHMTADTADHKCLIHLHPVALCRHTNARDDDGPISRRHVHRPAPECRAGVLRMGSSAG